MPQPNILEELFSKLNPTCLDALESAAGLCLARGHYNVEIEHFVLKLLQTNQTDIHLILKYFDIHESDFIKDIESETEKFKTGNSGSPLMSIRIPKLIKHTWLESSIKYSASKIRSGYFLITMIENEECEQIVSHSIRKLKNKISIEKLVQLFDQITETSIESEKQQITVVKDEYPEAIHGQSALDQFTINFTQMAENGDFDPIVGREDEINLIIDTLLRKRQNNPILIGEAGVGKTAIVEGLSLKIVTGEIPSPLQNAEIRALDIGLLQAGAGIKGEFEKRLKNIIKEIKSSSKNIILFIDEAHTIIGAGNVQGAADAANLLKPELARGTLKTIAGTTWSEYKKYFETDVALTRRFQVVKVEEPDEKKAIFMIRAIASSFEKHHNVLIMDDAISACVHLSKRYISSRYLPDKAVSVLDTACSRVALGLQSNPKQIEGRKKELYDIDLEINRLEKEMQTGSEHQERLELLSEQKKMIEKQLDELQNQFSQEKELTTKILSIYHNIFKTREEKISDHSESLEDEKLELKRLEKQLADIQKDDPLIHYIVNAETIADVISGWTGIPVGRMQTDDISNVLKLESHLQKRVVCQDNAITSIANTIQAKFAGIEDPIKPTGVFLLCGPSGVGKTETALSLAELLFGGQDSLVCINMSEYQEKSSVSGLKGTTAGYVGYGSGGILTEAVRKRPFSLVLLDEVEKAHADVMDIFYQVFDKGILTDGEGRTTDFRNTLIILTSNLATDTITKVCADEETRPVFSALKTMVKKDLLEHFKPAFLGRLNIIPYYPIHSSGMKQIIKIKLDQIKQRIYEQKHIHLDYNESIVDHIQSKCIDSDSGARNVDQVLTNSLIPDLSRNILNHMANGKKIDRISILFKDGEIQYKNQLK